MQCHNRTELKPRHKHLVRTRTDKACNFTQIATECKFAYSPRQLRTHPRCLNNEAGRRRKPCFPELSSALCCTMSAMLVKQCCVWPALVRVSRMMGIAQRGQCS